MSWSYTSHGKSRLGVAALATLLLFCATTAIAAERMVVAECFTSPTCGYCPYAGRALHRMITTYPDTFTSVQLHTSGSANFSWVSTRWSYYYQTNDGTPLVWFDGTAKCLGAYTNDNQMYDWYNTTYTYRKAVATDVSIAITGDEVGTNMYKVNVNVSMDANGTAKDMIVHVLQVLDNYPASTDYRYRNCARQHYEQTINLTPGATQTVTTTFTLAATDVAAINDVKIFAFAQATGTPPPKQMYNTSVMSYPFTPSVVAGDVDLDGDVDISDLAALLSTYNLCVGDPGYNAAADFVADGCITVADLAALLGNYGYPG